jgi:hypothetical protein
MMAIDSTNINKANNHLSFIAELAELKRPRHMTLEIQVLAWDRYNNVAGLNRFIYIHIN